MGNHSRPAVRRQHHRPRLSSAEPALTGNLLSTFNLSILGRPAPSLNSKLTLDYALPHGQVLDLRVENYYEGSYN